VLDYVNNKRRNTVIQVEIKLATFYYTFHGSAYSVTLAEWPHLNTKYNLLP